MGSVDGELDNFPEKWHLHMRGIKELAGKHTYEDIYEMLLECNMDPDEAAQRLLYIDTFHEVVLRHKKRRSNASTRGSERRQWTSGMQQRGAGGFRENHSSTYVPHDAGRRRQVRARPENNGPDHGMRGAEDLVPVHRRAQNHTASQTISSDAPSNAPQSVSNGSSRQEVSIADIRDLGKRVALPTVAVKELSSSNPGPTPAPTPTIASIVSSGARFDGRISESQSTYLPNSIYSVSVSGVYSSASDQVLLPSLNPRNPGALGAIKREMGSRQCAAEFSGSSSENGSNADQDGRSNSQEGIGTTNRTLQIVEGSKISEPSRTSSSLNHDKSSSAISKQNDWSLQVNDPSKVMKTQVGALTPGANVQSLSKLSVSEQSTSQLDKKLEKLKLSTTQRPVIFPDHILVPEAVRNGLTFGSLNDDSGPSKNVNKDSTSTDVTSLIEEDGAREPPLQLQTTISPAHEDNHAGARPNACENLSSLEIKPHVGGLQYPFLPTATDYGFGLVPPILGPHLVQVEATEVGNSPVPSTSISSQPATQPVGIGQNSVAVSPHLFPFLRQPYPSNYVPYNPYFLQLYMPHSSPQFLGHSGFPQQVSTGNIYIPPGAATGVKYPVSSMYKPGTIAGNLAHFGIPSGYGSYGSPAVGYGVGATMTPSSSASNEDLAAPELKEKNVYSTLKQTDEPHMWTSAPARDMSTLPGNFFYNFPQGQQVAFCPAHSGQGPIAGMYHLTQTTGAPTSVQSLPQQSQTISGSVESVIPPSGTYQQTHSQIHWNTKLLNRENI